MSQTLLEVIEMRQQKMSVTLEICVRATLESACMRVDFEVRMAESVRIVPVMGGRC